jgi:carbohydrate-selective porin OprB
MKRNFFHKRKSQLGTIYSIGSLFSLTAIANFAQASEPLTSKSSPRFGYYRFQVSDNISVTPGAFVLFNPEGDSNNDTSIVGVVRTTFVF